MTERERVLMSLEHQRPERIPYDISFTVKAHAKMVDYYGDPDFASKVGNCLLALKTAPANGWKEVETDIWEDQFGVRWNRSVDKDIGVVCNRLIGRNNLKDYVFPDPDDPSRYSQYTDLISKYPDRYVLANHGFSLFERAWTLVGMENLLMAMVTDKPFAHELLERILEFNLRVIDNACCCNIDAMQFGDDWGQQRGLIMGPDLWREFIKPRVQKMYQKVHSKGKTVFIHSCGKVDSIFPDLIDCGLNTFNPFQPEVMDVFEIKRQFGDSLCFFGGISTQRTLPFGTVHQVKDEVRRLLEVVGKDGGYIAAPAHSIPADAKPENIAAMIEVLQEQ